MKMPVRVYMQQLTQRGMEAVVGGRACPMPASRLQVWTGRSVGVGCLLLVGCARGDAVHRCQSLCQLPYRVPSRESLPPSAVVRAVWRVRSCRALRRRFIHVPVGWWRRRCQCDCYESVCCHYRKHRYVGQFCPVPGSDRRYSATPHEPIAPVGTNRRRRKGFLFRTSRRRIPLAAATPARRPRRRGRTTAAAAGAVAGCGPRVRASIRRGRTIFPIA